MINITLWCTQYTMLFYAVMKKKTPKGTTFKMTYTRVRVGVCAWVSRFSGHNVIVVIIYISIHEYTLSSRILTRLPVYLIALRPCGDRILYSFIHFNYGWVKKKKLANYKTKNCSSTGK